MSQQTYGKNLDNEIANIVNKHTTDAVNAHSMRGSGNTAYAEVDVLVRTPHQDVAIESKRTSVDTGEYAYVLDSDDRDQLAQVNNDYTNTVVLVKFTNREPYVFDLPVGHLDIEEIHDAFEPHVTSSGTLRLSKPETDDWPSATAGRPLYAVLLEDLALKRWEDD
jgi:Holliday junction resolvase